MAAGAMGAGRWGDYRLVGPWTANFATLLATAPAVCELDYSEVSLHVVLAPLDGVARRRARAEVADLQQAFQNMTPVGATTRALTATGTDPKALVPLFGHCTDAEDRLVLVTERIDTTLAEELAGAGPLPLAVVLDAAAVATVGLDTLHRAGVLHRGLAPDALARRRDGRIALGCPALPVLVEFATATTEGTGHEPPEVLSGGDWTPQAEVYALASTLWTLLAGRPPTGGSREQRLTRLLGDDPPRLRRPDVPEPIQLALRAGLARDPADRPAGAPALAALLTEAVPADPQRLETVPPSRPAPWALRPLGAHYLLETKIGAGSSGTVWRARRRDDGSARAVKLLRPEFAEDSAIRARLLTEAATLRRLSHPHLVRVHDLVAEGDDLAIVMDLVDGQDLRSLLRNHRVDRATGLRLLAEVSAGLAAVHQAGVVHRDVKPANVLVTRGTAGQARLTDFGLAKALDSPTLTRQDQLLGTPAYLAPELILGRPAGPSADVYALGIILYELLAGHRPFDASTTPELLGAHVEQTPARPPNLPGALWRLVAACLDKDPDRRPTAGQVGEALRRPATLSDGDAGGFATGGFEAGGVEAGGSEAGSSEVDEGDVAPTEDAIRPPPIRPAAPEPRRRRRWPLVAAGLAVAGAGVAVGGWWAGSADPAPTPAQSQASYAIPASVTVGDTGRVVLSWSAGAEQLAGFRGYLVLRDNRATGNPLPPGQTTFVDVDARSGSCYEVIALGVRGTPQVPPPPSCPSSP